MLVSNTVEYDARVRKSARSLAENGYEVIVLGVKDESASAGRTWEGFDLRLVPRRDGFAERKADAKRRIETLESRLGLVEARIGALRGRAESGHSTPVADRVLMPLHRLQRRRVKRDHKRAKEELRAAWTAKRERNDEDPVELESYLETWWPAVRRLRPDVVHVHDTHGMLVARRAAARGARWVFDAHEDPLKMGDKHAERIEPIRRTVGAHMRHADAVITVSAALAERLSETFDLPEPPVVVHNTPLLREGPTPEPGLRQRAGVAADTPLVAYVGSMTRWHRQSVVLEALTQLPAVHFALVVSPSNKFVSATVARAGEMGLSDRVHVVPKVPSESLVGFLGEADVECFRSSATGTPTSRFRTSSSSTCTLACRSSSRTARRWRTSCGATGSERWRPWTSRRNGPSRSNASSTPRRRETGPTSGRRSSADGRGSSRRSDLLDVYDGVLAGPARTSRKKASSRSA